MRIWSRRRSANGAVLGRPHGPLPPVMIDPERDGTRWDCIMASLRQAGTGKPPGRTDLGIGTTRDSNRRSRQAWESWSSDVGTTPTKAGSSPGRQGPSGARTMRGGAAATLSLWGARVIMTGERMTPHREQGTHRARVVSHPAVRGPSSCSACAGDNEEASPASPPSGRACPF